MGVFNEFKKAFSPFVGKGGSAPESKRGIPQVTPDHVPEHALADIFTLHDSRMPETPKRIRDARDFLAGKKRAPLAEEFDVENREAFRGDGADKYERAMRTARRLAAKRCRIKRPKAGESRAAARLSTGTEQFAEGVLQKLYDYGASIEILLNEGELFLFASPAPKHWTNVPTLFDDDQAEGPHLSEDEYQAVPEHRRHEYEPFDEEIEEEEDAPDPELEGNAQAAAMAAESEDDEAEETPAAPTKQTRYKRIKQRYRVDAEGQQDDGSDTFEMDRDESNLFYKEEMELTYGKNIPVVLEFVYREDCIPINPRFSGDGIKVDGVIRRTLFSRSELVRRGYRYFGMDEQLEPANARDGRDGDFWLYEYRTYDEFDRPFIVYQVGERQTAWADGEGTAVIKLWEEYPEIDDILVHYGLGQHWSGANWDLNSQPFSKPYMQDQLNRDAVVTGLAVSTWLSAFPTWGQRITRDSIPQAISGEIDLTFTMKPNAVQPLYGELVELTSRGTNNDVKTLLTVLKAQIDGELPSNGAFGGEGPTSGLDRQVTGRDMEISYGDVIESGRRMYEAAGRFVLMICTALAKKAGKPVELWIMSDTTVANSGNQSPSYSIVKLTADQCGRNFDVIAEFPNIPGENLAGASLFQSLCKDGLILREEFRTLWGDPSPEIFEAKLRLQRFYDSEAGQLDLLEGLADYMADNRMKELMKLTAQGKATAGGQQPVGLVNDLFGAGGASQNPGGQALGGQIAGARQADAASAGSPMDGMSQGGLGMAA